MKTIGMIGPESTELPLILTVSGALGIPHLDTTQIHVEAILAYAGEPLMNADR